ncbi:MAG: hypothetical protein EAY75_15915, partial [Bacteroidetes bacterium]
QQKLGAQLAANLPPQAALFSQSPVNKVVEYYAKRTFNTCASPAQARQIMMTFGITTAYWLHFENNRWLRTDTLQIPPTLGP